MYNSVSGIGFSEETKGAPDIWILYIQQQQQQQELETRVWRQSCLVRQDIHTGPDLCEPALFHCFQVIISFLQSTDNFECKRKLESAAT